MTVDTIETPAATAVAPASASTELASTERGVLAVLPTQQRWTDQQKIVLRTIGLAEVKPEELGALLHASQRYRLDPFAKQISMIPNWDSKTKTTRHTIIILLDGYLALAERTNRFLGIEGPYWCGKDGQWSDVWFDDEPAAAAKITVRYINKFGEADTCTQVAMYRDRVRLKQDGQAMALWKSQPGEMLANAALRLALRRSLPEAFDTVENTLSELNHQVSQAPVAQVDVNKLAPQALTAHIASIVRAREDAANEPLATRAEITRFQIACKGLGWRDEERHAYLANEFDVESTTELTAGQIRRAILDIQHRVNEFTETGEIVPPVADLAAAGGDVVNAEVIDDDERDDEGQDNYDLEPGF